MTFIVDLRRGTTSTETSLFRYCMLGTTSTATRVFDPAAYIYSMVNPYSLSKPEDAKPRVEDDLISIYDDPWELP